MRASITGVARHAVAATFAALLTACGSQSQSIVLPSVAGSSAATSGGDLLYVSGVDNERVRVFTYPQGRRVRPKGFAFAILAGDCADIQGNVYIVWSDFTGAGFVYEYPHGSDTKIRVYSSYDIYNSQCSVNPKSGDLAVTEGNRAFLVFPYSGKPKTYSLPSGFDSWTCTYDDRGNLYVNSGSFPHSALFELPKGRSKVAQITLPAMSGLKGAAGAIRWDGKYLAFANHETSIYRLTIHGTKAVIASRIQLEGVRSIDNIWIQGSTMVASDSDVEVHIWNYPAGGKPTETISFRNGGGFTGIGVAVSVPPSR